MKILIIENSIAYTGAFKCALEEAMLLKNEHEFIFVINERSNLEQELFDRGFKVYKLPFLEIRKSISVLFRYPFRLLRNTVLLWRIVRQHKPDVVQVNDLYNLLGAMLKMTGYKGKLLTYVRFLPSALPGIFRSIWVHFAQKHSYKVIAVSDIVLDQLPANDNTIRIYDPVNFTEHMPAKQPGDMKPVKLLYLGNYIKGKGQDYALRAFYKAKQQGADIVLRFVGGDMGLAKNKHFKKELETNAKALGIEELITFAPFNSNVEQEIKAADVLLNFSDAESLSMTTMEACIYGTPVIATKCGGPQEIIDDGRTGILVPVADITAITAAIVALANDAALRMQLSMAAKAYVREKFSTEKYIANFTAAIKE